MSGLPFSGKTTLSKKISESLGIKRVSFDETWVRVEKELGTIPGIDNQQQSDFIISNCENEIKEELKNGRSVIYDTLAGSPFIRKNIKQIAQNLNSESQLIYVNVSKETVLKRREQNLIDKQRYQVEDKNFYKALDDYEVPKSEENPLIYNCEDDLESWISKNIKV